MKDQLGNEITVGATVIYSQANHSITPLVGTIVALLDDKVAIGTQTNRTIGRYRWDVIVYTGGSLI